MIHKTVTFLIGAGVAVVALFFVWFVVSASLPYGEPGTTVQLEVEKGEALSHIARTAEDEGLVRNSTVLQIYATITGRARNIKTGTYEFLLPISTREVVVSLGEGGVARNEVQVVIPEGFTLEQIQKRLTEADVAGADRLLRVPFSRLQSEFLVLGSVPSGTTSFEGFLFPDTYRFKKDATAEDVLRRLIRTFTVKTEDIRAEAESAGISFYDRLILASILEREVPHKDMQTVAGILLKRMENGVALQVDATLAYALGRPIVRDDIDTLDSPYNTYQHRGLPPTPISNPGLVAIEAALNPVDSPYWYYLSRRSDGETIFSRTLEEHNRARARYLR